MVTEVKSRAERIRLFVNLLASGVSAEQQDAWWANPLAAPVLEDGLKAVEELQHEETAQQLAVQRPPEWFPK